MAVVYGDVRLSDTSDEMLQGGNGDAARCVARGKRSSRYPIFRMSDKSLTVRMRVFHPVTSNRQIVRAQRKVLV